MNLYSVDILNQKTGRISSFKIKESDWKRASHTCVSIIGPGPYVNVTTFKDMRDSSVEFLVKAKEAITP